MLYNSIGRRLQSHHHYDSGSLQLNKAHLTTLKKAHGNGHVFADACSLSRQAIAEE